MTTAPVKSPPVQGAWPALRRIVQVLAFVLLWAVVFFACAGRLDWPRAWIFVALDSITLVITALLVVRMNAALIAARGKWHKDTKSFDKVFTALHTPLVLAFASVPALDAVRFGWTSIPFVAVWPAALVFEAGMSLIAWAMVVNPFLEPTIRIQRERGHCVIAAGPYRVVRHPMYLGMLLSYAATPVMLGSMWTLAVSGLAIALFIWRTALEDRTLRQELAGYSEYAAATRSRLLPGIW